MLVIRTANGNTYPAETCVWRTAAVAAGEKGSNATNRGSRGGGC